MRIGRLFGIPLRVDWSWLLVFALLVWTLSMNVEPFGAIAPAWRVLTAASTVLIFFACVVTHELAHALTARRFGIKTRDIVLFVFGGVSRMERAGTTAKSEALITLAGPAASLMLALFLGAVAMLFGGQPAVFRVLAYLAVINVMVAAFNLLPAYPIDGGRVVHAIAWHFTGDRLQATRIAAGLSAVMGGLLGFAGALLLLRGFAISGVWTILIAWFIFRTGQAEVVNETEIEPLKMLRCADVADPRGPSVAPDASCAHALDVMAAARRRALPVGTDAHLMGLITLSDFSKLAGRDAHATPVTSIMTPTALLSRVSPETNGLDALKQLTDSEFHQLPVIGRDELLMGFVNAETIRRAVAFSMERRRLGLGEAMPGEAA